MNYSQIGLMESLSMFEEICRAFCDIDKVKPDELVPFFKVIDEVVGGFPVWELYKTKAEAAFEIFQKYIAKI